MHENAWVNCFDCVMFLNVPWYSYNDIIIIATDVIIFEFLYARFVHPGAS